MALRSADRIVHKAAWLYYSHGLRQDEVAQRLGISRATVAMYLKRARETGIVSISTSTQLFGDDALARQLEDLLDLESVWIVPTSEEALDPSAETPVLAASVFLELVKKGDRIGVAWGKTVYQIADVMSFADLQGVTVVQLCGNLGAPYSYRPDQCTMEIARRLNAKGINIYAPLVLSSETLAAELRAEPMLRDQLDGIAECTLALFSVGGIDDDSHIVECGALSKTELRGLRAKGAAGVIAGQLIDGKGQLLDCAYNRKLISADLDSIRAIQRRLLVVQQDSKLGPLMAALEGGFATHLVLTSSLAKKLIAKKSAAQAA
ncbi:MAG TPA: sugar-binding transcriptional regulator [Rhizobiaceae bacterium]|nr:sugar-binding transcriptional regulator [Rhizobiaceae bacterium]